MSAATDHHQETAVVVIASTRMVARLLAIVTFCGVAGCQVLFPLDLAADADPGTCEVGHDEDGDLIDDGCDVCPHKIDPGQADRDNDGLGDECDWDQETAQEIVAFYSFSPTDGSTGWVLAGGWSHADDELVTAPSNLATATLSSLALPADVALIVTYSPTLLVEEDPFRIGFHSGGLDNGPSTGLACLIRREAGATNLSAISFASRGVGVSTTVTAGARYELSHRRDSASLACILDALGELGSGSTSVAMPDPSSIVVLAAENIGLEIESVLVVATP